jgi:hypothetical protein
MDNDQIIMDLLLEFKIHRDSVMKMIDDLEEIKVNINTLIPRTLDARNARFFEEKVKSVTELFKTLLEMRKEIQKSLKEEIDLRRKIRIYDNEEDSIENLVDIRSLVNKVESFKKDRDLMRAKTLERAQRETDEIAKDVVVIQDTKAEEI